MAQPVFPTTALLRLGADGVWRIMWHLASTP